MKQGGTSQETTAMGGNGWMLDDIVKGGFVAELVAGCEVFGQSTRRMRVPCPWKKRMS